MRGNWQLQSSCLSVQSSPVASLSISLQLDFETLDRSEMETGEHESPGQPVGHCTTEEDDAILLWTNSIIGLSQQLNAEVPRDRNSGLAKSLAVIESKLRAHLLLATAPDNCSWLPEKENIAPNQHTWPKTAA